PPDDPATVYAEGQYGRLFRINVTANKSVNIQPRRPNPPAAPYRFNWNSPLVLSPHDSKTLYFGGNVLFKSNTRGDRWERKSPDLTRPGKSPVASYSHTLTAIAESPLRPGLLYTGSDDGKVHVSRDDGHTWTDVTSGLRVLGSGVRGHVTRIECSPHAAG